MAVGEAGEVWRLPDLRKGHPGDLSIEIDCIEIGHAGDKIDDTLDIVIEAVRRTGDDKLFGDQL
jgi:hypothetical protein